MRRIFKMIIVVALVAALMTGCGAAAGTETGAADKEGRLKIVATVFPQYDWAREILGQGAKDADLVLLQKDRVDLHSYQPTVEDMVTISDCDILICVGGQSDRWVDDALKNAKNKDMKVIRLMEVMGDKIKEEELVEGMEAEDEQSHGEGEGHGEDGHGEDGHGEDGHGAETVEYDEHVWLSLRNAKTFCRAIEAALSGCNPAGKADYQANLAAYEKRLEDLDSRYEAAVKGAAKRAILVGDRFPFRYMVDDYGIEYFAAFAGCSAETNASFQTVTTLAKKVDELGLSKVVVLDGSDEKIANSVISNTAAKNQGIVVMNSLQSVGEKEAAGGVTYLSVMEDNLKALAEALS